MLERKPRTALGLFLTSVGLVLALAAGSAPNADSGGMLPSIGQAFLPSTVSGRSAITGYVNAMTQADGAVYVGGEFARIPTVRARRASSRAAAERSTRGGRRLRVDRSKPQSPTEKGAGTSGAPSRRSGIHVAT